MITEKLLHLNHYSNSMADRKLNMIVKPFIFSNAIAEWQALKFWTPRFLKEKYGDLEVITNYNLPDNISPYLHKAKPYTKKMCLSDFVDAMPQEKKGCYLAQTEINMFSGIENYYDFNNIIPITEQHTKTYINLWMGCNTRSGLHYDYEDNFLVQIYGIKKVFLAPPKDTKYIYPLPENFLKSQVNPMLPDFKKYPKFKYSTILEGELKPGDVLFIPKGWHHYIYSPGESISLNCWYGSSLTTKDLIISFYRAGLKVWIQFIKDFFWHGVLARPAKERLYCSPPLGQLVYDSFRNRVYKYFFKV